MIAALQRKVRTPQEENAGYRPAGETLGIVQQKIYRHLGKVEKVMVRAHRNCSNTIGIVNPIWSKAK